MDDFDALLSEFGNNDEATGDKELAKKIDNLFGTDSKDTKVNVSPKSGGKKKNNKKK